MIAMTASELRSCLAEVYEARALTVAASQALLGGDANWAMQLNRLPWDIGIRARDEAMAMAVKQLAGASTAG